MTNVQPSPYLDRAIAGELGELRDSANAGRNNTLFKVAARLYGFSEAGVCDTDYITGELEREASTIGLGRDEVRTTLKSARRRATQLPESEKAKLREKCGGRLERTVDRTPIAPESCDPPNKAWQATAGGLVLWAQQELQSAPDARSYLHKRGLTDKTITTAGLGYNPVGRWSDRARWGLAPDEDGNSRLWIPQGIVIPCRVAGTLWKVQVRRDVVKPNQERYKTLPGSANALYNADAIQPNRPAMLVEGPFDALAVQQTAGDVLGAAACGTSGAHRVRWLSCLLPCSEVLISLDADPAGDRASTYWLEALPNTKRWRPYYADPAQLLEDGQDVRGWVLAGLNKTPRPLPLAGLPLEYWREEVRLQSIALKRLACICAEQGYDYEATLEVLR